MVYFIGIVLFMIGALLGSFCTLAIYRIPRKKDIIHERSFCPNCNHKLGFKDLIPIVSYLFLGGKCAYCKQKIAPKYFLIEIFSGLAVLLFACSLNFNLYDLSMGNIIYLVLGILYLVTLVLIAGIDKEHHQIQKGVLLFGIVVICVYILYLYIIEKTSVYRYAIYMVLLIVLALLDMRYMKKQDQQNYVIQVLMLSILLAIFSGTESFIYTVITTLLAIAVWIICHKKKDEASKTIPIGFFLCIFNMIWLIVQNFLITK